MTTEQSIKAKLLQKAILILDEKTKILHQLIASAKESRDSDSKSSVGDKYETNRAMMHIEIGKNEALLNTNFKLKNELEKINPDVVSKKVEFGSIVYTSSGNYFTSVALGKIEIEGELYYSISLASPIGKVLCGNKVGDKVIFQNKDISIDKVL